MQTLNVQEQAIETTKGAIYTKTWAYPGSSSPIVLIHDSLGSTQQWRQFPEALALATARTVISYDRLGYGFSAEYVGVQPSHFMRDEVTMFQHIHRALGLDEFLLFGHSVGGPIAAMIAAAQPKQCLALMTAGAPAFMEAKIRSGVTAAQAYFEEAAHLARLRKYHQEKTDWVLNSWISTWLDRSFDDWCLSDHVAQLACPILSLHGDQDEYGSFIQAQRYSELSAFENQARLLPGCGHVPHVEQPNEAIELVKTFIEDHILASEKIA
ncbi:MAG: alpha/beta hydrolase [Neisseriaceae bacterium]|nr:alpha/beta hydrolase [Neisseriaceae bacterium]